ncbi:DUF222 domain-containing protein [Georgenia sp. M64]|uniref:HNH endonuclease n=1 Tax=Georgenia sp. M64 TaxID=3120520 RepID=UPI0030E1F17C
MARVGGVCEHLAGDAEETIAQGSADWDAEVARLSGLITEAKIEGDQASVDWLLEYCAGVEESPEPENEPTVAEIEAMDRYTGPPPVNPPLGQSIRPAAWQQMEPDSSLAALLEDIDVTQVDPYQAVEIVAAYKRMESWAAGMAALAAAALAEKDGMSTAPLVGDPRPVRNGTPEELAIRLGTTRTQGQKLVRLGRAMTETFAPTGDKLLAGEIDVAKAEAIVSHLWNASAQVAWLVQDEILGDAPGSTVHQLTRQITKTLIAVDPDDATNRHHRAARERRVTHPAALPDAMASATLTGPVHELAAFDLVLDAAAAAAKAAGDRRTRDQLRYDAAMVMAQQALATGWIGAPPPDQQDSAASRATRTTSRTTGCTGWAIPRIEGAFTSTPRPMRLAQAAGGRLQIDVTIPLSLLMQDPATTATGDATAATTNPSGTSAPDGPEAGATAGPGAPPGGQQPASPADPAAGPRGGDDEPEPLIWPDPAQVAELRGYGPITPDVARALATGGVWRRLVTDPLTGGLLDVGRARYRPPPALAAFIRARDRTCVFPGCTAPAAMCQIDHTLAWSQGGRTDRDDLGPLCEGGHVLKTDGLFTVIQPSPGTFEWTTPSGHRYRREINGTTTRLPRAGVPAY